MHNQPIDQEPSSPDTLELDQRLTRALEAAPEIQIPADFAARVASLAPDRPVVSSPSTHYGDYAVILGILATLAAMFWLGPRNHEGPAFSFVESFLLAEFIALTFWLSLRRHSLR